MKEVDYTINKVSYDDLLALLGELDHLMPVPFSAMNVNLSEYSEKLYEKACTILCQSHGKPVGLAAFYANNFTTCTAYLTFIALKSQFQGCGIGKNLLVKCEQLAKQNSMLQMRLEVQKINERAILFYQKAGYKICASTQQSYYMEKNL